MKKKLPPVDHSSPDFRENMTNHFTHAQRNVLADERTFHATGKPAKNRKSKSTR